MKIVCGTDFSETATASCLVAADLAKRFGDTLIVVHASEPWVAYPPDLAAAAWRAGDTAYSTWANQQMQLLTTALRERGVGVEELLCEGFPEQVLTDKAREVDARLILVGRHGRRGRERWFVGSTTERVIEKADRPVLVITDEPGGLQLWARGGETLHVAAAVDETASSDAVVEWLKAMRERTTCDVTVVHSFWPPEEYARLGLGGQPALGIGLHVMADLQRHLQAKLGQLPGTGAITFRTIPAWSRQGEALAEAAEEVRADLIVVGTHQRHGLSLLRHGSVSRELLRESRLPVLCVPGTAALRAPGAKPLPLLRRVLVPTDLSDVSNAAIPYAFSLVRDLLGTVELLYVVEGGAATPAAVADKPTLSPDKKAALEKRLRDLVPREARDSGLVARVNVVEGGHAADVIAKIAERYDVDAICMSPHGRTGVKKLLLGSVTQRLLESTHRPVMLVRPPSL